MFEQAREFLAQEHASKVLDNGGRGALIALDKAATVGVALKCLGEGRVLSAPVLDEEREYYGCLSVGDILKSLIAVLKEKDPEWGAHISRMTIQDMNALGAEFCQMRVDKLQHPGDLWLLNADNTSSILDVVIEGFRIHDNKVHHRIFVCSPARDMPINVHEKTTVINIRPGSEKLSATALRVSGVVSQSDVVRVLYENKQVLGAGLNVSVDDLSLDMGAVFTLPWNTPTLEAFGHMAQDHKSCLGITDSAGRMLGNLSVSDLRGLGADDFPLLLAPVAEFLLYKHNKISKEEVLAGSRRKDAEQLLAQVPLISVKPQSTLGEALELLATKSLHRVYVIDDEGKPVSIITLTDILRCVSGSK